MDTCRLTAKFSIFQVPKAELESLDAKKQNKTKTTQKNNTAL